MRSKLCLLLIVFMCSCNREYWREYKQALRDNPRFRYERLKVYLDSVERSREWKIIDKGIDSSSRGEIKDDSIWVGNANEAVNKMHMLTIQGMKDIRHDCLWRLRFGKAHELKKEINQN